MSTNLSKYIKQERLRQGFNAAQLSEMMGYKNINKGMRRIIELEREGKADPKILRKVVTALNLDQGYVDKLIKEDRAEYIKEFERWLNEPVKMTYTIRAMPAVYLNYDLPDEVTAEDRAIQFVANVAKEKKLKTWLNLSKKEKVYITEEGEVMGKIRTTIDYVGYPFLTIM